jgi:hypothetical protein
MVLVVLNRYFLKDAIDYFQNHALPRIMGLYETALRWALKDGGLCIYYWVPLALLILSFIVFIMSVSQRAGWCGIFSES